MKVLVTNVMLPVAIFHALATAEYNRETGILILIMLIMLVVSFSLGFVLKPFLKGKYQRYLPFMVSVYEGGLMAYPLYTSLCGSENLSHVAVLDIAGLLFGFSIYMGMLGQVEDGGKIDVKKLFSSAIRTPAFIASVLGIIAGLSKIIIILLDSPFGGVYQSCLLYTSLQWYNINKRILPWRDRNNAYYTWVSEIMLQQTRVEAVKPYFQRFITALPDVQALAQCPQEQLLKLWEGLGYYNRVRNMQEAARQVVSEHQGIIPEDYQTLLSLKGIGSYTAGAIASIAYHKSVPAVDGNVLRVITRITENNGDISRQSVRRVIAVSYTHLDVYKRQGL